ncbi:MAG: arylsulfatase [Saprospiraceae bacterium]
MRNLFYLSVLLLLFSSCQKAESNSKPNIIFILADDLGYNELGCYGQTKIETPNIDALAENGIRFTQHYSGSPVCAPSRCIFLTGQHSGHAYVRGNDEWTSRGDVWNFEKAVNDSNLEGQYPMPSDSVTIAELLKEKGYVTGMVGKWGLGAPLSEGIPTKQGFDFFYGYNCQRQAHTYYPKHLWKNEEKIWLENELVPPGTQLENIADSLDEAAYKKYTQKDYAPTLMHQEALQFIDQNKSKPFFLYYASPIPHLPLQAPQRWVDFYKKKFGAENPYPGGRSYFPNYTPRATYAAMVSYLDEQVGELVEKLKAEGIYENTLIVFTSDNGPTYDIGGADSPFFESGKPFRSDRGWGKGYTQEGGIRVPMIAHWPAKIKEKSTSNHLSAFWDWLPTFCEMAGVESTFHSDGVSLLPTLIGVNQKEDHEFLYWEFPSYKGQQAVRMGKWKAIRQNMFDGNLEIELFDLEKDLACQNNVADQFPKVLDQVKNIMEKEHQTSVVERFRIPIIDEVKN